ncbi:hypothetical protein CROQUDRAFT_46720 [Cronartium quercuum f. sp. fusiforme G11]|uniref:Major facilitator superfamily MFS-1 n=1 Tax=Cronartium quercuum f. sp. fusiforme G11 TaxID=708437 RepID=A0A9P6NF05_9BASI|nr:hypothetical protein CROQUDRAFT_46720 [Cronartium quercuum f. sp. fusiforme G11]
MRTPTKSNSTPNNPRPLLSNVNASSDSYFNRTNSVTSQLISPSGHYPRLPPSNHIPIPSAIPPIKSELDSTPLPTLPIVVLCFAMISEFLSASVAGPFIFFMIEDFSKGSQSNEAAVGFWAGIVSSVFFLSQFLTSLLWSNISNQYGRRLVLFTSLLGNALTLLLFGSSTSLGMMICARLGQGIFNGAIGVARGAVRDITDSSNEGRAIAWIGLCWGMGGITGPIIGGLLEHPAENYPKIFENFQFLKEYPYFLPCAVASFITFAGACLSLFLGWDGGYRSSSIRLPPSGRLELANQQDLSTDEEQEASVIEDEGITLTRPPHLPLNPSSSQVPLPQSIKLGPGQEPLPRNPHSLSRTSTLQSTNFTPGSAYGYDRRSFAGSRRPTTWRASVNGMGSIRNGHATAQRRASRAISLARSFGGDTQYAPDYDDLEHDHPPPTLNFAQRLLLANEDAVFGLHDVWLAAATSQDRDDEFSQVDDDEPELDNSVFGDDESQLEDSDGFGYDEAGSEFGSLENRGRMYLQQHHQGPDSRLLSHSATRPRQRIGSRVSPRASSFATSNFAPNSFHPSRFASGMRSVSIASSAVRPAIYNNTGLSTPPSLGPSPLINAYNAQRERERLSTGADVLNTPAAVPPSVSPNKHLAVIPESGNGRHVPPKIETQEQKSVFSELPLAIIAQYAIVALHGTTCDQLFMSFLVTPVRSGGLGLSAGHYAELIAAMCIAQIVFQFRFYPTVGPPRGKLTHLSMLRLGMCLYIPVYLLLPELRALLRESHTGLVMAGMILLSTFRWLANVCAYTSVMVMINAQTPSHLVPLANGLAQSAVSGSRFIGPVFGGLVWSFSITPSPDARPYPFNNALGFFVIALICATGLMLSFRLK